ncbi:DEAD/DEAH box helicase [Aureliella helgolandensis]|uniref:DEAD-box ATP-dependent RNA helicase RhpA n=1 Tax=Aureliella helgolandensis TaxID=2527968 RepID=A0A518G2B9_9BACT|nr:DEAD/DEAH box helicase [Aureliella helgolandensis]QDV22756.1 ATP-dependent RNA helicase RhlE [Aureliella helgolandensis]
MKTFEELDLIAPLQRALAEEKYTTPTPIQAQTIPPAVEGRDVLGCAQTGTGKTAAFALPILNQLGERHRKARPNCPIVLVLAPTRELAIQIGESFETYGRHLRLRHVLVYGGVSQGNQVRSLNRGAHVLVATPGRLVDLMSQGHIELSQLEVFVLDEADRMLDMGFLPDLKRIINKLPDERQSLFFSATLPPKIRELSQSLLSNPVTVNVTPKSTSVERIEQRVFFVERNGKLPLLRETLQGPDVDRAIVFTRTKRGANMLSEKLCRSGIRAVAIHGNKSQSARTRALDGFRRKDVSVLVATDVAARGIDIDGVSHVVNYDMPVEPESYVHRIGRTGRAGADGIALSFCSSSEREELRAIEQLIGKRVPLAANQPERTEEPVESRADSRGGGGARRSSRGASRNGERASSGHAPAANSARRSRSGRRPASDSRPPQRESSAQPRSRDASRVVAPAVAVVSQGESGQGSSEARPRRKGLQRKVVRRARALRTS